MNLLFDDVDIFEDDFDILEIIEIGFPRLCCIRSAHFHDTDESTFYRRFRLTEQTRLNLFSSSSGFIMFSSFDSRNFSCSLDYVKEKSSKSFLSLETNSILNPLMVKIPLGDSKLNSSVILFQHFSFSSTATASVLLLETIFLYLCTKFKRVLFSKGEKFAPRFRFLDCRNLKYTTQFVNI
jgi:hypothetical protein